MNNKNQYSDRLVKFALDCLADIPADRPTATECLDITTAAVALFDNMQPANAPLLPTARKTARKNFPDHTRATGDAVYAVPPTGWVLPALAPGANPNAPRRAVPTPAFAVAAPLPPVPMLQQSIWIDPTDDPNELALLFPPNTGVNPALAPGQYPFRNVLKGPRVPIETRGITEEDREAGVHVHQKLSYHGRAL
jgi:hypothetical protein